MFIIQAHGRQRTSNDFVTVFSVLFLSNWMGQGIKKKRGENSINFYIEPVGG